MNKLLERLKMALNVAKIPAVKKLVIAGVIAGSAVVGVNVAPDTVSQVLDASSAIIQVVGE